MKLYYVLATLPFSTEDAGMPINIEETFIFDDVAAATDAARYVRAHGGYCNLVPQTVPPMSTVAEVRGWVGNTQKALAP